MAKPVRVLLLGTGEMGSGIARLLLRKQGLELVGAFARRTRRAGMDLGPAIGLERELGISIGGDLGALVETCRPRVAVQATCSRLSDAKEEILALIRRGVSVISIAEEMAYPAHRSPESAAEIRNQAVAQEVAVVGTGINPGFVLDLLVITLSGVCADIRSIRATRVNDLSPYGPSVLRSQGVGLTPEAFIQGLKQGRVVGHYGFGESIRMIAAALGWEIERIEQRREPIVSRVRRETPRLVIEPGQVAGCRHTAVAYRAGEPVIELIHPQQVRPELEGVETGDRIEIRGTPDLCLSGSPEIPGGVATAALAVNMIPRVLNAAPGLYCMAELPPPAAMLGDIRDSIEEVKRMGEPIAKGSWVEIHRILLAPGERAPHIPEETRRVPLEMRVKGFLLEAAAIGEEARIETPAGRTLFGTLARVDPPYDHGFGPPLRSLCTIGPELRALLRRQESGRES